MLSQTLFKKLSLLVDKGPKKELRQEILSYYNNIAKAEIAPEVQEALEFLKKNRLHVFPYSFTHNYSANDIKVYEDKHLGLRYVMHHGRKLYFKRTWSKRKIRRNYNFLLLEQDTQSPHCYLTPEYNVEQGDIVVDAGAAEGNFALTVIEQAEKVYLFETDNEWIEALEATFAPWKEKVEIVNKFVSNVNNDHYISLDSYFQDKGKVDFIKADVEGAEAELLDGSTNLIAHNPKIKIAVATYHKQKDQQELSEALQKYGFNTRFSNGYMLFPHMEALKPPYFRRGLIRAWK